MYGGEQNLNGQENWAEVIALKIDKDDVMQGGVDKAEEEAVMECWPGGLLRGGAAGWDALG